MPASKERSAISGKTYGLHLIHQYRRQLYGISMLWIILYHAMLIGYHWPLPLFFLRIGNTGFDMLLFLFGISLFFSYSADTHILHFYQKHVLKLYIPMFTVIPLFSYFYFFRNNYLTGAGLVTKFDDYFFPLGFWTGANSQIWFIPVLFAAIVLFPLVFFFIFREKENEKYIFIRTCILCCIELVIIWHLKMFCPEFYNRTAIAWTRFPIFTLGGWAGFHVYGRKKIPALMPVLCMAAAIASGLFLLPTPADHRAFPALARLVIAICLVLVLPGLFRLIDKASLRFVNRFLGLLGSVSLEMYLIHNFVCIYYRFGKHSLYKEGSLIRYLLVLVISFFLSLIGSMLHRRLYDYLKR